MRPPVRAELVEAGTGDRIGWEFFAHPSTSSGRTENFIGKLVMIMSLRDMQ